MHTVYYYDHSGKIQVIEFEPIKRDIEITRCYECAYFHNKFCTQYAMEVDDQDGCSNYELKRGVKYGNES